MCADLTKTVEIVYSGRDELSAVTNQLTNEFKSFDDQMQKITGPLATAGEAALKLGTALATLAVGGMAYAVKAAGEFGGAFGEISTLIKDTGAPVDAFGDQILKYSTTSVKSLDDITKAIYTSLSAGVLYGDSIEFLNAAEQLSVAGRSNLNDTTKVLISTLNAYGAGTDQASKYSDVMFTTVQQGLTTMTELSTQLAEVTGLAASAGVPFETLSAAIAALTASGLPTEQAITGIKAALQNIIKPSGEAEKMAQSLGLQFNATALETKGFEGVLWEAWTATGGNTTKMAELFGSVEALNAVLILASDKTGKFKASLEAMANSAGATQIAYAKVADEFANINTRMLNQFKAIFIVIGQELLPTYSSVVASMVGGMAGVEKAMESGVFGPLAKVMEDAMIDVEVWAEGFAETFPNALEGVDFTKLASALKNFFDLIGEQFPESFDFYEMKDSIQFVVDSLESFISILKGMGEGFAPLVNAIKTVVSGFNSMDTATKETVGNLLAFSMQWKMLGPQVTLLCMLMSADAKDMEKNMVMAFQAMETGVNVLKVGFFAAATAIATAALGIASVLNTVSFGSVVSEADLDKMRGWVDYLGTKMVEATDRTYISVEKLNNTFYGTGEAVKKATTDTEKLTEAITKVPAELKLEVQTAMASDCLDETKFEIAQALMQGDYNKVKILTALAKAEAIDVQNEMALMFPPEIKSAVKVNADGSTIQEAYGLILQTFPDDRPASITSVGMSIDEWNLAAAKSKMSAAFPEKLPVEIQAKIDIAQIEASSKIVQASIEWKAKIDIAQIESATKIMEAMFGSLNTTIESTGSSMASMFGTLAEMQGMGTGLIERQIEEEARRRDEALRLQTELTEAQIDLLREQVEAMKTGGAMIEIDGKGLQPHLEAFMFEILAAIQVKANAEGMKFLVGV